MLDYLTTHPLVATAIVVAGVIILLLAERFYIKKDK
jgi:hypothetical protein